MLSILNGTVDIGGRALTSLEHRGGPRQVADTLLQTAYERLVPDVVEVAGVQDDKHAVVEV